MNKKNLLLLLVISYLNADTIDFTNSISPRDLAAQPIIYGNTDVSFTTSIVGLSLERLSDNSSRLITSTTSKLVLQNTNLILDGDYSFTYSSLQIVGDVNISGCGNTFKFFGNNLLISPGSTLRLSDDITFDYTPSSSSDRAIVFQDCNSTLFLDNATLNIDNGELSGLRLHNGKLKIAGDSTVSLASTFTDNSLFLGGGAEGDTQFEMVSDATLTISSGNIISQNNDATSFKIAKSAMIDGNFLFKGVSNGSGSVQAFDLLNKICNLDIARLSGVSLPGAITGLSTSPVASADFGDTAFSVNWSKDGKYLAVGGEANAGGVFGNNEVGILEFTGSSLNVVTSIDGAGRVLSVVWSPDNKHIAVGSSGTSELFILLFENNTLSTVASVDMENVDINGCDWSPDGRFLAVAAASSSGGVLGANDLGIFEFTGTELILRTAADLGGSASSFIWSPCGTYVAVSGNSATGGIFDGDEVGVLKFNDSSLTVAASLATGTSSVGSLDWSLDGKFLAIAESVGGGISEEVEVFKFDGSSLTSVATKDTTTAPTSGRQLKFSPDGRFIAFGGFTGGADGAIEILEFTGDSLITSTVTQYFGGSAVRAVDWFPNGEFLALCGGANPGGIFAQNNISVLGVNYESTNVTDNVKNFTINSDAIKPNSSVVKNL